MTSEIQIWKPSDFKGSDLLPIQALCTPPNEEQVGLENMDAKDIILPKLSCLQGMSEAVTNGVPGAQPGKFLLSSTDEIIEGPLRTMVVYHFKSRALYPDERKPEMAGLEACFSRDALIGTRYGECVSCDHSQWRPGKPKNKPPLCQEAHNFVVLTKNGPAVLRMAGTSYQSANKLLSGLKGDFSRPNFWDFPAVIASNKNTGPSGAYYTVDIRLDRKDVTPPAIRAVARKFYDELKASFEHGKLSSVESDGQTSPNAPSAKPFDEDNVPF